MKPLDALWKLYTFNDLTSRNPIAYLLEQENLPTYYKIIEVALKELETIKERPVYFVGRTRGRTKAMLEQLKNMPAVKVQCLDDTMKADAFDILKKQLVVSWESATETDLPSLVVGVRVSKDDLVIIYSTNDEHEINVLRSAIV